MVLEAPGIAALGVLLTLAVFAVAYWDGRRTELDRPLLWATIAAVPVAIGAGMYLSGGVPMTGVLVTGNTGIVLYGFEREIANGEEESMEPGTLPNRK